jgi:hypothetical protein
MYESATDALETQPGVWDPSVYAVSSWAVPESWDGSIYAAGERTQAGAGAAWDAAVYAVKPVQDWNTSVYSVGPQPPRGGTG